VAELVVQAPALITALLILFARIGAVWMLLPLFGEDSVPGPVRLLMALGLSLALHGVLGGRVAPFAADEAHLIRTVMVELAIGLSIGSLIRVMMQSAAMAGAIISMQIGFSSALVFDPAMGGQTPVLAKLIALAATLACFSVGLHHLWIGAIVRSYDMFPVGVMPNPHDWAALFVATLGKATALAVSLSAPFLIYGILFNVALGLSARLAPGLQVFFIAQPANLLLGLALLGLTIGAILTTFASAMSAWTLGGWSHV
jgi:flagellar biosynthesis protein FliR